MPNIFNHFKFFSTWFSTDLFETTNISSKYTNELSTPAKKNYLFSPIFKIWKENHPLKTLKPHFLNTYLTYDTVLRKSVSENDENHRSDRQKFYKQNIATLHATEIVGFLKTNKICFFIEQKAGDSSDRKISFFSKKLEKVANLINANQMISFHEDVFSSFISRSFSAKIRKYLGLEWHQKLKSTFGKWKKFSSFQKASSIKLECWKK